MNKYGANETNGLENSDAYYSREFVRMGLKELAAKGGRVTRVRLVTERIMGRTVADLSYAHGVLPDGTAVSLYVTGGNLMLCPMNKVAGELIRWAKGEGVYAKGIGLLDRANWSTLS